MINTSVLVVLYTAVLIYNMLLDSVELTIHINMCWHVLLSQGERDNITN